MNNSEFDGGLLEYVIISIIGSIITLCTFGLGAPWALCMIYKWKIEHTIIEGRRLRFHGKGGSLFLNWIKWYLLTLITFGIYGFWVFIKLEKWKVRNTSY